MVIRHTTPPLAITQPAHAWLAGQLGRAWGNASFPRPPLYDELVFATEQHDVGYLEWEQAPTVEPTTGVPHVYRTLPCGPHLRLWRNGVAWMTRVSRFAALMISLHSSGLYQRRFDWENASATDRDLIRGFLSEQESVQAMLLESLVRDVRYRHLRDPGVLDRYTYLVGTWDLLSLHVCEGTAETLDLTEVPGVAGPTRLRLTAIGASSDTWTLDPWPFEAGTVEVCVDGRPIHPPYADDDALRSEVGAAPARTIHVRLQAGGGVG